MITLGNEEPIIDPKTWIKMSNFVSPCDRYLFVFWERPLNIGKEVLEYAEEIKLKIPALKSVKGRYKGVDICISRLYVGAPAATMALEFLIAAGIKKFLVFGGCGAIHPSVKIYDIVIPTWGIREEGTSYHYLPPDVVPRPSERVVKILHKELDPVAQRLGIKLHLGGIWTTDAIFRETRDKVRKYSEMNILGVDMESTALMAVAMYRGVELGIALVVTDELYGEKWMIYQDDDRMAKIEKEIVKHMIEALAEL